MKERELENEHIKFWIEDGFLFAEYKPEQHIDLVKAQIIVRDRLATCNGHDYPHIILISGIKNTNKDARDYFATGDGIKNMQSMALITTSPISKSIGNFFLFLTKPAVPTKLFTSLGEAKNWSRAQAQAHAA